MSETTLFPGPSSVVVVLSSAGSAANNHVETREGRCLREQVPDVPGSSGGRGGELRRQHGCEESVRDFGEGSEGAAEQAASCSSRRHGDGHGEEGKAGSA